MTVEEELAAYDAAWDAVPEPGELPEGTYAARIARAVIQRERKDPERLWLALDFDVPGVGQASVLWLLTTTDEKRLAHLKRSLRNLGFTGRLSEMPDWLPGLVDEGAEITVKLTDRGYRNVYVNRRIEPPAADDAARPDEVPF